MILYGKHAQVELAVVFCFLLARLLKFSHLRFFVLLRHFALVSFPLQLTNEFLHSHYKTYRTETVRKHALALKQFTHENDDCVEIAVSFVGKFSFLEASVIDLRILEVFDFRYQIFLSRDFWFGESCAFRLGFLCFGLLFWLGFGSFAG